MTQALRNLALTAVALVALCLPTVAVHQFNLLPPKMAFITERAVREVVGVVQQEPSPAAEPRRTPMVKQLTTFVARTYQVPHDLAAQIVRQAVHSADRHGLEPTLVLGVIAQESSFNKEATSSVGAQGLMQVMPEIHADLTARLLREKETLYDVGPNVKTGTYILAGYLREARGDLSKALRRYSGGANNYEDKVLRKKELFDGILPASI